MYVLDLPDEMAPELAQVTVPATWFPLPPEGLALDPEKVTCSEGSWTATVLLWTFTPDLLTSV